MQKWEYKRVLLEDDGMSFFVGYDCACKTKEELDSTEHSHHKYIFSDINKLGLEGWELVSVDDNEAHFKRPITVTGSLSGQCGSFETNQPPSDEPSES